MLTKVNSLNRVAHNTVFFANLIWGYLNLSITEDVNQMFAMIGKGIESRTENVTMPLYRSITL